MNRHEFLSQIWQAYPIVPEGNSFLGRIHEIILNEENQYDVTLMRQGRAHTKTFSQLLILEDASLKASSILLPGDIVAISTKGIVTLLAPQLQKLPARTLNLETLQVWQEFLFHVREFFKSRRFTEIETPGLVICPGTEPSLDLFKTDFVLGSKRQSLYLPTSPELHLKKALSLGAEKIFEIKKCYRNGEVTEHHQPEFTMIEWYRAYDTLQSIQTDVQDLIEYLVSVLPGLKKPEGFELHSIRDLFKTYCDFDLKPETSLEDLKSLAEKQGIDVRSAKTIDDYFFLIFLEKIESSLPAEKVTIVQDYPPYQAALARITPAGWGDRFEVYWQGLEIANAFHELNNPEVQKKRFAEDLAKKMALGKELMPLDPEFMQCLEAGLPPSGGIALGLERLFMALTNLSSISHTRLFPLKA